MKLLLAACLFATVILPAQQAPQLKRPRITGVAHIALFVHDIEKSRAYYRDLLGYQEVFDLKNPDGSLSLTFVKINDRQYIELFPEKAPATDRLNHISIEVDDAEAMRAYLGSKGITVPEKVGKGRIKNSNFNVKDPDGHTVEIVQYEPDGWTIRDKGKAMDGPRISTRMLHLGILVGALEPAMKFYRDILGFEEIWRGSRDPKRLDWVNMKVPDGNDYIEFMLYDQIPAETARGSQHHICLEVADIDKSLADLQQRPAREAYTRPMEIRTGINRKRQLNLFDPDGTRSELMESKTVDGKPAISSQAPPPH
ncbi:MAG: VOC family protein [Bryobacteraceae bacterium]|nr:VOC family protein [Bryobacteraceae bacterium]